MGTLKKVMDTIFDTSSCWWKQRYTKSYEELWNKIRDLIRSITNNSGNSDEKYTKIKFNSDDHLPLKKYLEIYNILIVVRPVFHEGTKYYPNTIF